MRNHIPVIIVGDLSRKSIGLFNPNAFPSELRNVAVNCGDQLALIENSLSSTITQIESQRIEFMNILKKDPSFKGFKPDPKKPATAYYHNLTFLTDFITFFVYLKAFLDQYARLVSRLIDSRSSIFGFNKQKIDGQKISGGRLINWLSNSAPSNCKNCLKLADIFKQHAEDWLDESIALRDSLLHSPYFLAEYSLSIPLTTSTNKLSSDQMNLPMMPGINIEIPSYMEKIRKNLYILVHDTLPLLPNVNFSLLSRIEHMNGA